RRVQRRHPPPGPDALGPLPRPRGLRGRGQLPRPELRPVVRPRGGRGRRPALVHAHGARAARRLPRSKEHAMIARLVTLPAWVAALVVSAVVLPTAAPARAAEKVPAATISWTACGERL